jgi:hypothetical protein
VKGFIELDTLTWIENLENYYSFLWKQLHIPTDERHSYIVRKDQQQVIIHPDIQSEVESLNIRFHSRNNPKSSQLLALNLFSLAKRCDIGLVQRLLGNPDIRQVEFQFEWIDKLNSLQQGGNPSNHDLLIDCGKYKYLVEMKFTEHTDAPCGSSKRNGECNKPVAILRCPLVNAYGTLYYPMLRSCNSPYNLEKFERHYKDCPFLYGEQFQIMRYILLCHLKTKDTETWKPIIICPRDNDFMYEQINLTKSFLKDPTFLTQIYLEDVIEVFDKFNKSYAMWLTERYMIKGDDTKTEP